MILCIKLLYLDQNDSVDDKNIIINIIKTRCLQKKKKRKVKPNKIKYAKRMSQIIFRQVLKIISKITVYHVDFRIPTCP